MEISLSKSQFLKSLQTLASVASKPTNDQIIHNVSLKTTPEKKLWLSATNHELDCQSTMDINLIKPGEICVNANHLLKLTQETNAEELHFSLQEKNWVLVKAGKAEIRLSGIEPGLFPTLEFPELENKFELDNQALIQAIDKTLFAISEDPTRNNLTGLSFQITEDQQNLRFIGADGFRISQFFIPLASKTKAKNHLIIPKKSLPEIKKVAESTDQKVLISFDSSYFQLQTEDQTIKTKLIQEEYPNVDRIMIDKGDFVVKLSCKELTKAVRLMEMFLDSGASSMKLSLQKKQLKIESESSMAAGQSKYSMDCDYTGEQRSIGFHIRFFSQALKNFEDLKEDELELHFMGEEAPCMLTCPKLREYKVIAMPMRIEW